MSIDTVSFVMDLESEMQGIVNDEYSRFLMEENVWWDSVTKIRPSATKREILAWMVNTAQLLDQGQGGNTDFRDPMMIETEYTSKTAGASLSVRRQQLEDIYNGQLGGEAKDIAGNWARDMARQFAYWPQEKVAELIKAGESGTTYDNLPFFYAGHYTNGKDATNGTFSNLITGAAGTYNVDSSVTLDVAATNLAKIYTLIRQIKMPNGTQPRMLRPEGILCGPSLYPRLAQLLDAKFLAASAASGGGSADFAGYLGRMGYGRVIEAPEFTESEYDKSYFIIVRAADQLGALAYINREPFSIRYFTGRGGGTGVDAILDRTDSLEWHASGRNVAGYGHPFLLIKVKPS